MCVCGSGYTTGMWLYNGTMCVSVEVVIPQVHGYMMAPCVSVEVVNHMVIKFKEIIGIKFIAIKFIDSAKWYI